MSKQDHDTKRSFVIQKHDASQLHYDFRLEMSDAGRRSVRRHGSFSGANSRGGKAGQAQIFSDSCNS